LNHAIRRLQLKNICARHIRIEQLAADQSYYQGFDIITSRAFSSLRHFVSQALPLLKRNGLLLALKGKAVETELKALGAMQGGNPVIAMPSANGAPVWLRLKVSRHVLPHLNAERRIVVFKIE
jgi:hypothetical protein